MSEPDAMLRRLPRWMTLLSVLALACLVVGLVMPRIGRSAGGGGGGGDGSSDGGGGDAGYIDVAESQLGETFWEAPDFALNDQRGEAFAAAQLAGQVWVAEFFFTNCPGICPVLSLNLQDLYADLSRQPWFDQTRVVSFSLDPERDTPAVLEEYAQAIGADPARWVFLTGTRDAIWRVSDLGFRLAVADNPQDPRNPIAHTGKLVLVDRDGRIRGFYDGLTPRGMAQLRADLERLVKHD